MECAPHELVCGAIPQRLEIPLPRLASLRLRVEFLPYGYGLGAWFLLLATDQDSEHTLGRVDCPNSEKPRLVPP